MIIWLASYPRSGNTLLRTVLKQTMGLDSYSDELIRPIVGLTEKAKDEFGHRPLAEPWESFYERATASEEAYLVKTHLPPRDNQPTIYVVRDGRRSLTSYLKYHQDFLGDSALSLLPLVLGEDYYGSWSTHYKIWVKGDRPVLLLRYEDLIQASPELIKSMAHFVSYKEQVADWSNPFERLRQENPKFFRLGEHEWQATPEWTPTVNAIFFLLHGELMRELGYANQTSVDKATTSLSPELIEFIGIVESSQQKIKMLESVCAERLSVINILDQEVRRLKEPDSQPRFFWERFVRWGR